jgi:hypothetical protein
MSSKDHSFAQVLLESIDESFSILGNEPSAAVYQYLVTICSLPRNEIPDRIQDFDTGIKKALGTASKVIERMILRKVFDKLGFALRETQGLDFVDYVTDAKRRFEIVANRHSNSMDQLEIGRSKKGQVSG